MSASSPTDISGRTTDGVIASASAGRLRLHGFAAEAFGGSVRFRLRSGDAQGCPLLLVNLLDGQTVADTDPDGLIVPSDKGIWFEHVAGGQFLIGMVKTNQQGD